MSRKTPAVAYITRLIRTTGRNDLLELLYNSPLRQKDIALLLDYAEGVSYKELAEKYGKSPQRIYQWKRNIYENLHFYLVQRLTDDNER